MLVIGFDPFSNGLFKDHYYPILLSFKNGEYKANQFYISNEFKTSFQYNEQYDSYGKICSIIYENEFYLFGRRTVSKFAKGEQRFKELLNYGSTVQLYGHSCALRGSQGQDY